MVVMLVVVAAIGYAAVAAMGCSSAAEGTGSGSASASASGGPTACAEPFLEVTGDGLPQRFTTTSASEVSGGLGTQFPV